MFNKSIISCVLLFSLLLGSVSSVAQTGKPAAMPDNVPALLAKANESYLAKDYPTFRTVMERLNEMRPNNSGYMYQLVIAYALLDEKSSAYNLMLRMQQQGLSYDFSLTDNTLNLRGTEVFDYVNDLMKMAGEPMGESEAVFTLPQSVRMPEAIAWDESRQKFLIGTITDGSIFAVGKDGLVEELLKADTENGMWAVFDIMVDGTANRLWVTSASTAAFSGFDPVDKGRSALFEFNLETLELVHRHPVPVDGRPHILGSMALGPKGDIFIADRTYPILYKKPAGEQKLVAVLASRDMVSMRGIAMQPDGRVLYIADREMGIMVVDVEGGRAGKLGIPTTLNIAGIDGLYLWDNKLFIIQNGIQPQRVMRLQLDAAGTKVTAVRPLAVAQPEFDYPSFGAIEGEDLYFFASSQMAGRQETPKPVTVLKTPLNSSEDLVQPDMRKYLEEREKKLRAQQEAKEKE